MNVIRELAKNTETAIKQESENVKDGLELVKTVEESFAGMKNLLKEADDKVREISKYNESTSKSGEEIASIIDDIKELLGRSLEQVEYIAASTQQQTAAMQEISASFDAIDKTAGNLTDFEE